MHVIRALAAHFRPHVQQFVSRHALKSATASAHGRRSRQRRRRSGDGFDGIMWVGAVAVAGILGSLYARLFHQLAVALGVAPLIVAVCVDASWTLLWCSRRSQSFHVPHVREPWHGAAARYC